MELSCDSEGYLMIARRALMGREMVRVDLRPGLGLPRLLQVRSPPIWVILIPKLLKRFVHVRIRLWNRSRDSGEMMWEVEWDGEEVKVEAQRE